MSKCGSQEEYDPSILPPEEELEAIVLETEKNFAIITYINDSSVDENLRLLKIGDIIVEIDNIPVCSNWDINLYLMKNKVPGDIVELTVLRPMFGKMHKETINIELE